MIFAEALFLLQKPFFGLQSPSLPLESCQKQFWPLNSEAPKAKVRRVAFSPARNLSFPPAFVAVQQRFLICALTANILAELSE